MFGELNGLPVHALVVHSVVIFAPVSALIAIAFLVPGWRRVLRWPLLVTALIATGSAFVAKESGERLMENIRDQLEGNPAGRLVDEHQELGERLFLVLLAFLAVAVIAVALASMDRAVLGHVGAVVVAIVAIAVGVLTVQTGERGTEAVWNPTGTVDYK